MKACDIVVKSLNFVLQKCVFFPSILVIIPIIFIMEGKDGCAKAKEEIKEVLRLAWTGDY